MSTPSTRRFCSAASSRRRAYTKLGFLISSTAHAAALSHPAARSRRAHSANGSGW
jgi:hypothetical protein